METAAEKMYVQINAGGSLQDLFNARVRTTDNNGQAVGPSERK
jgi:hypothetical protein